MRIGHVSTGGITLVVALIVFTGPVAASCGGANAGPGDGRERIITENPSSSSGETAPANQTRGTITFDTSGGEEVTLTVTAEILETNSEDSSSDRSPRFEVTAGANQSPAITGDAIDVSCTSPSINDSRSATDQSFHTTGPVQLTCTVEGPDGTTQTKSETFVITTTDHCFEPVLGEHPRLLTDRSVPGVIRSRLTGGRLDVHVGGEGTLGVVTGSDGEIKRVVDGGVPNADYRIVVPRQTATEIANSGRPMRTAISAYKDGAITVEPGSATTGFGRILQTIGLAIGKLIVTLVG